MLKQVGEYVTLNNEYVNVKGLEEKTKAKRQKSNALGDEKKPGVDRAQQLDIHGEVERCVDGAVAGVPERIREGVRDKILIAIGYKEEVPLLPIRGNMWNQIKHFYSSFTNHAK
jgi:hypothetical protein